MRLNILTDTDTEICMIVIYLRGDYYGMFFIDTCVHSMCSYDDETTLELEEGRRGDNRGR